MQRSLHVSVHVVFVLFLSKTDIFYFKLQVSYRPVGFTRDTGCLARDGFLVILKRDHYMIGMYIFAIVLLMGTVLQYTS